MTSSTLFIQTGENSIRARGTEDIIKCFHRLHGTRRQHIWQCTMRVKHNQLSAPLKHLVTSWGNRWCNVTLVDTVIYLVYVCSLLFWYFHPSIISFMVTFYTAASLPHTALARHYRPLSTENVGYKL